MELDVKRGRVTEGGGTEGGGIQKGEGYRRGRDTEGVGLQVLTFLSAEDALGRKRFLKHSKSFSYSLSIS